MQYDNHQPQYTAVEYPAVVCSNVFGNQDNGDQLRNAVEEAAYKAGCQFLFEIPGILFGFKESRAAAIKMGKTGYERMAFVLCDNTSGIIHILNSEEVPDTVSRFVESYANVLNLLQADTAKPH